MKKLVLNILEFLNLKIESVLCKIKFSNMEEYRKIPITYLPLSSPTRNYLMRGRKTTVESVLSSDLSELSELRNLSKKFIEEICSVLVVYGFYSEKLTGSKRLYEGLNPYEKTLVMAARIERFYRSKDSKSLITEDRCKEIERKKLDIVNGYLRGDDPMSFQNSPVVPLLDYVPYLEEDSDEPEPLDLGALDREDSESTWEDSRNILDEWDFHHEINSDEEINPDAEIGPDEEIDLDDEEEYEEYDEDDEEYDEEYHEDDDWEGSQDPKVDYIQEGLTEEKAKFLYEDGMAKLNNLIALDRVKEEVESLVAHNKIQKLKKKPYKNFKNNMVFLGNPGVGKTTVAEIIGEIFAGLGFIESPKVVTVSRKDLCARYVGHTAIKTKEVFESALGGVLFIDEAYSLLNDFVNSRDSFGKEAVDTLTGLMTEHERECLVILAGYEREMNLFFENANVGFKERFNTFIHFEDYSNADLFKIFKKMSEEQHLIIDEALETKIIEMIDLKKKISGEYFSNARAIKNILQDVVKNQEKRLYSKIKENIDPEEEELYTIKEEDLLLVVKELEENLDLESEKEKRVGF